MSATQSVPPLIDVPVAGRLLGLSRQAVYRRVKDGSLPVFKGSGRKKIVVALLSERIGRPITAEDIEAATQK